MGPRPIINALPTFNNRVQLIEKRQNVYDIVREIVEAHKFFASDYDKIAQYYCNGSTAQICESLYKFCKSNIKYKMEPEARQTTKSPAAILAQGFGDCKHYASYCGGVLDALNRNYNKKIDWCYRFASYSLFTREPEHVFIVVNIGGREKWIDPVPGAANYRPVWELNKKVKAKNMPLYRISGINDASLYPISDVLNSIDYNLRPELYNAIQLLLKFGVLNTEAKVNDRYLLQLQKKVNAVTYQRLVEARQLIQQNNIGGFFGDLWQGVKTVTLAAPRNAFLGLVGLNFFGYARKLSHALYNADGSYTSFKAKLKSTWEKAGGNFSKLEGTIRSGEHKKAILGGIGVAAATLPAWIAVAAAVIAMIMPLVNAFLSAKKKETGIDYNIDPTTGLPYGAINPYAPPGGPAIDPATGLPYGTNPSDPMTFIKSNPWLIVGGLGVVYLMTNKK